MRLDIPPLDSAAALDLCTELGVSFPVAQLLVRRGLGDLDAARDFLAADEGYDVSLFGPGLDEAVAVVLRHVAAGTRITVHGDYDVDGVCSTAILVRVLTLLGASVDWFLPSRQTDGYGLQDATVDRLVTRGTGLLITADCAVTAVEAVAHARAQGMDVVVTDHHAPRADGRLPDAPLVHPGVAGYPCPELCAAGVAYKLAGALLTAAGRDPGLADVDLDLVALATIADCVPLVGENRRLVRAGLRAIAGTRRPGLRALLRVARVDPSGVDAGAVSFRLAPRINAAGRLHRADAGVELLLTADAERAAQIADELDHANAERRIVEQKILWSALEQVRTLGEQPAYVLAGEGWHPGVIGIVASRVVEQTHRPCVVIALDGDDGTGSGRSIAGFDLLAGLNACAGTLLRHGGHRAAAGCTIARSSVDAFREAFVAHAAAVLRPEDLVPRERVDAVVAGDELGLALADELAALAPFGIGNPAPRLLVPSAEVTDVRPMGAEGEHLRATLHAGGVRAKAVAFRRTSLPEAERLDVTVTLEVDEFQGAVEPRLVVREARPAAPPPIRLVGEPEDWRSAVLAELDAPLTAWDVAADSSAAGLPAAGAPAGPLRDRRGPGAVGVIAALVHTGEPVLVLVADAHARARHLAGRLGGFDLASWRALERDPALPTAYRHVVVLDPPAHPALMALARGAGPDRVTHLAWGSAELHFAEHVHVHAHQLREPLAAVYRGLRDGADLTAALGGERPWAPVLAGRVLRVATELGLLVLDRDAFAAQLRPPAGRLDLEASPAYRGCAQRLREGRRWLSSSAPAAPPLVTTEAAAA